MIAHHGTLLSPCLPWDLSGDLLVGVREEWAPLPEAPDVPLTPVCRAACGTVRVCACVYIYGHGCMLSVYCTCLYPRVPVQSWCACVGAQAWLSSSLGPGAHSLISCGSSRCPRQEALGGTLKAGGRREYRVCLSVCFFQWEEWNLPSWRAVQPRAHHSLSPS